VNGQTVSLACTAYRDCKTGALVGTDCWNDQVCPSPAQPAPTPTPKNVTEDRVLAVLTDVVGDATTETRAALRAFCGLSDLHMAASEAALRDCAVRWCASQPVGRCDGPAWLASHPTTNVPAPPGPASAPPTPIQQCDAPLNVTLGPTERWVEVDPVQCLWQIVRTSQPGQPQVLPNVYGGQASILIPQSAGPGQTTLSPGAVGLYQPSWQLPGGGAIGGLEISAAEILQAYVDVLGRGPTPEELTEAEGQHFGNVAELYAYLHDKQTAEGADGGGGGASWFAEHPYLSLGAAAVGAWLLFGRRR
jgi:hypothetical protein